MKTEIQFRDVDLDEVMRYFAEGFEPKKGKVLRFEYRIDTHLRRVVFILTIQTGGLP